MSIFTFEDYLAWEEVPGIRHEILGGIVYDMAAPSDEHQRICYELGRQIGNYLLGKTCEARPAPYAVRLNATNVVEPDLTIVCDRSKIKPWGCDGVPDMVIEVSSPSSGRHDSIRKFNLYRTAGVREYWIVRPDEKMITVCLLQNGEYFTRFYDRETSPLSITVLDNCMVDLHLVFPENLRL